MIAWSEVHRARAIVAAAEAVEHLVNALDWLHADGALEEWLIRLHLDRADDAASVAFANAQLYLLAREQE